MLVHVPANVTPRQIDVPADVERSRKGALHIQPISTMELTEQELAFLKKTEPALVKQLIVFGEAAPSLADKAKSDPDLAAKLKKRADDRRDPVRLAPAKRAVDEPSDLPMDGMDPRTRSTVGPPALPGEVAEQPSPAPAIGRPGGPKRGGER